MRLQYWHISLTLLFFSTHTLASPSRSNNLDPSRCAFEPTAKVSDACASYAYLDDLNSVVSTYVRDVVTRTDFFSYYRLNLYNKKCPFWNDEAGLCGNIACAVSTLDNEADIPPVWRAAELSKLEGPKAQHPDRQEQRAHPDKPLHGELGKDVGESCVVEYDDECDERDYCVPEDERASAKGDYVSLVDNPERFTGYSGPGARQVWDAIYRENCFSKPRGASGTAGVSSNNEANVFGGFGGLQGNQARAALGLREVMKDHGRQRAMQRGTIEDQMEFDDECVEKRIFYRVISGMHASISTHLCHDYLNQTTGEWGPNVQCFKERMHDHPERISNLYFNYALVLRAVGKLKDHIGEYTFCSGDPVEDKRTKQMVRFLAESLPPGPELFDESILFQDNPVVGSGVTLKEDFKARFRNISRIMDCTGCDKCRLWGKLQTAGYGTALKVLFEFGNDDDGAKKPLLRRTELVALMNTLDKISHAIKAVRKFEDMLAQPAVTTASEKVVVSSEAHTEHARRDRATSEARPQQQEQQPVKEDPPREDDSLGAVLRRELVFVWKVYLLVFKSWLETPGKIYEFVVDELGRAWHHFVGLPVGPRAWEIRRPSLDEL